MLYNEAATSWIATPDDYEGFPVFSLIRGVKLTALVAREHGHVVYVDDYTGINGEAVALTCRNCARRVVTWIDHENRSVNAGSGFSWLCEGSTTIAPKFRQYATVEVPPHCDECAHVHSFHPREDGELICACGKLDASARLTEPSYLPPTPGVPSWREGIRRAYEVTGIARFDGRSVKIATTLNRKEAERIAKYQSRGVSPWASVSITEVPAI